MPPMWNIGSGVRLTDSASNAPVRRRLSVAAARLRCVVSTPFGTPVVPDVYICTHGVAGLAAAAGVDGVGRGQPRLVVRRRRRRPRSVLRHARRRRSRGDLGDTPGRRSAAARRRPRRSPSAPAPPAASSAARRRRRSCSPRTSSSTTSGARAVEVRDPRARACARARAAPAPAGSSARRARRR